MRVVVAHIWGSGTVVSRAVDATENTSGIQWDELTARALADPQTTQPVRKADRDPSRAPPSGHDE